MILECFESEVFAGAVDRRNGFDRFNDIRFLLFRKYCNNHFGGYFAESLSINVVQISITIANVRYIHYDAIAKTILSHWFQNDSMFSGEVYEGKSGGDEEKLIGK